MPRAGSSGSRRATSGHRRSPAFRCASLIGRKWRKGFGFDAALALHRYLFDYLNLPRSGVEIRADNAGAFRIAERLGYEEYARGHEVYYRDGAYVDEIQLFMDLDTWNERWTTEREYAPLAADATR